MAGYMQAQDQVQALVAEVKTLTVDRLKALLRTESLTVSGIKSELQIRIIAHIEKLRNAGDQTGLSRVRASVRGVQPNYTSTSYPSPYTAHTPNSSASPQFASPNHRGPFAMSSITPFMPSRIIFKNSPFYNITEPLSETRECKARETTRETARVTVNLSEKVAEQLAKNSSFRVMVFCAAEGHQASSRECDIAFPHNVELKCNSDEVKGNLRGLKNRPGSTRPADITHLIKKRPGYSNLVEMVYALTTKDKSAKQKFYLVVNLVLKKSIESMVSELRQGRKITKEQVLREMRTKAEDPDEIVATSTVLPLKDPVAYTRIVTPCRSISCTHNQCFDAASYLQLQEQAPTWICPICNKGAPWDHLAIDQYVDDILNSTRRDAEAVVIQPDGQWSIQKESGRSNPNSNPTPSDDEDEDDDDDEEVVEIQDKTEVKLKVEALTPHSVRTPLSSREDSSAPSTSRPHKRPRNNVIDLTLSDDEDIPAPKAPRTSDPSSGPPRVRPPAERYRFQFPPPGSASYNFDRFNSSF